MTGMYRWISTAVALMTFAGSANGMPLPKTRIHHWRIGNVVFIDKKVNSQTQLMLDENNTAYLVTFFANKEANMLRISGQRQAKEVAMYMGWPYLLDEEGRLFAMDTSWKTLVQTKIPIVLKRLLTKSPIAFGTGAGLYALGWINIWVHSGGVGGEYDLPATLGVLGTLSFYVVDSIGTFWFRTHHQMQTGGNFFTKQVDAGVDHLEYDAKDEDYFVYYKDSAKSTHRLSDVAPADSMKTSCLFALSTLVNK